MAFASTIVFRIDWCRRRKTQTLTQLELAEWHAEEEGLRDALLDRDHTHQYRYSPPGVFERYAMGLQDGQALSRVALVDPQFATPATRTHV